MFGNGFEQFLVDPVGIAIQKPDPLLMLGFNLGETRQQHCQPIFQPEIFPV